MVFGLLYDLALQFWSMMSLEIRLIIHSLIHNLFDIHNSKLNTLFLFILIIGGFILITLAYVSFRKYKGEKEALNKKEKKR